MTFSNRGNDRFRGTNYGKREFGDRGSDRPTMHDATCAKCGAACQVPFMPNGRKEVFCSKCFGEMNGDSRDSRNESRSPRFYDKRDSGSNYADKPMFSAICDQCGKSCQVPFRPTNGKPVLCSNCFADKNDGGRPSNSSYPSRSSADNSGELQAINEKLDKIIKLLAPVTPKEVKKEITEKILEEIKAVKPRTKKKI